MMGKILAFVSAMWGILPAYSQEFKAAPKRILLSTFQGSSSAPVCKGWKRAIDDFYFASAAEVSIADLMGSPEIGAVSSDFMTLDLDSRVSVQKMELGPALSGYLYQVAITHSWRGHAYSLVYAESVEATERFETAIATGGSAFIHDIQKGPAHWPSEIRPTMLGLTIFGLGGGGHWGWTPWIVRVKDDNILMARDVEIVGAGGSMFPLYSWQGRGRPITTCVVKISPDFDHTQHGHALLAQLSKTTAPELDKLERLDLQLRKMLGARNYCGTLNSHARRLSAGDQRTTKILIRPWEVANNQLVSPDYNRNFGQILDSLFLWQFGGLWEKDAYRDFARNLENAQASLEQYYHERLGYSKDEASKIAAINTRAFVTSYFNAFGLEGYQGGIVLKDVQNKIRRQISKLNQQFSSPNRHLEKMLTRAILADVSLNEIDAFLSKAAKVIQGPGGHYASSPPLAQAVRRPEVVKLMLDYGLNPNVKNEFGKTPIMYAAQYDNRESFELLLKAGADLKAMTQKKSGCGFNVAEERSVLDYALANASLEIVNKIMNSEPSLLDRVDIATAVDRLNANGVLSASDKKKIADRFLNFN